MASLHSLDQKSCNSGGARAPPYVAPQARSSSSAQDIQQGSTTCSQESSPRLCAVRKPRSQENKGGEKPWTAMPGNLPSHLTHHRHQNSKERGRQDRQKTQATRTSTHGTDNKQCVDSRTEKPKQPSRHEPVSSYRNLSLLDRPCSFSPFLVRHLCPADRARRQTNAMKRRRGIARPPTPRPTPKTTPRAGFSGRTRCPSSKTHHTTQKLSSGVRRRPLGMRT